MSGAEGELGGELGIKWVNDIYRGGKKVCGILTEAITDFELGVVQSVIVGIGINLRPQEFPAELTQAASLDAGEVSRNRVIAAVAGEVLYVHADAAGKGLFAGIPPPVHPAGAGDRL
ncbi:MAG: hypothetical protein V8Q43_03635 [Christensenellaceae bacterium]